MRPADRSVLITGCSSGIGRATAIYLAARGFRVWASVRSAEDCDGLRDLAIPGLRPALLDVTSDASAAELVRALGEAAPEGLYALVNNAGVGLPAAVELTTPEEFRALLEVNAVAPLRMIRACLPLLRAGRGRIVNVTSLNGSIALPMVGAYSASKFALEALSDTLRVELRPWKIPVSVVAPGQVSTPMFSKARAEIVDRLGAIPPELLGGYLPMHQRAAALNERGATSSTSPPDVAAVIFRVLSARRPSPRYHLGWDSYGLRTLARAVPQRVFDRLLARIAGTFHPLEEFRGP